ncbi:MAG: GAF domain-containing protein, partial [Actinomycetales bacterium]
MARRRFVSALAAAQSVVVDDVTARAVSSLRSLRTVDEIVDAAPQVLTSMGFERVIFSDVTDGVWTPLEIHIPRDAPWARDILEAGRSAPQELTPQLIETDMIRQRRPYIVREVQDNPRVNQPIAMSSRSSQYLAAPVTVGDQVGVLLHVDRYFGGAPFSSFEATQLAVFAEALGMAIERAQL